MPEPTVDQAMQIAVQHHQAGRLQEAEQIYRQILAQQPQHPVVTHHLGLIAHQFGRHDVAVDLIRRAIALAPDVPETWSNLGNALAAMGQLDDSIAAHRQAIVLAPNLPEAYFNLGSALGNKGEFDDAISAYRRAIAVRPNYAEAHSNLGNTLRNNGRLDEAIAAYRAAIELRPEYAEAYSNLGNALKDQGRLEDSRVALERAVALRPEDPTFLDNLLFSLHYHPDYSAAMIYQEQRLWNKRHAQPLAQFIRPHGNTRDANRRLKIGYVSGDLTAHSISRFLLPVIEHHDPAQVEVFCYSAVRRPDEVTGEFREHADVWRDIVGLSDEQAADLVRQDAIDILIDVAMHTAHNRLLVFARKPSPVQVTWLAYPGGTGMDAIDYRITDRFLDPLGVDDAFYSETSVRLPDCWCCYRPRMGSPSVNDLPALGAGHVTFGCLNNFCKATSDTLACWCRLLRESPGSRILLHASEGTHRQSLRELFAGEGIDPHRLSLVGSLPTVDYLRLYHQIDIGLDPFPYSGGTTSCDAMWMGVPVVSLYDRTAVGRGTATLLHNIGLRELVADSQEKYVQIAKKLAGNLPRLSQLRTGLRRMMQASPLMNETRFTRNLEAAYREMWRKWCEGYEKLKDV